MYRLLKQSSFYRVFFWMLNHAPFAIPVHYFSILTTYSLVT
jgi:hypothetical protein